MNGSKKSEGTYYFWKYPWQKWLIFLAAVLQMILFYTNIQEYQKLSAAGIFSPQEWHRYAAVQSMHCAFNGFAAALFFGVLFIGYFTHSKKAALLAEGVFLLLLALIWGITGFALRWTVNDNIIIWIVFLILMLCGGVYSLWRWRE